MKDSAKTAIVNRLPLEGTLIGIAWPTRKGQNYNNSKQKTTIFSDKGYTVTRYDITVNPPKVTSFIVYIVMLVTGFQTSQM